MRSCPDTGISPDRILVSLPVKVYGYLANHPACRNMGNGALFVV